MKNTTKLFGLIALAAAIAFTFAALSLTGCDNGSTSGKGGTYTGTANGVTYTLKIEDAARAAARAGAAAAADMTWTPITDSPFSISRSVIYAIAYGNNKFVAGDYDYKMAYSTDGVDWAAAADRPYGGNSINAIAFGNNRFVAGSNFGAVAYSDDGITWETVLDTPFHNDVIGGYRYSINAIAFGNNRFVAGGENGEMAYSSNGVNWNPVVDSKFDIGISAIAYGGGKFVAVGDGVKMAYSLDGVSWTPVADSKFDEAICAIAYGNGKFVAVGWFGEMAYSSNGVSWTAVADSTFEYSDIFAIAWGGNRFVAGGAFGDMAYSSDGVKWTIVSDSKMYTIEAIAYGSAPGGAGIFVAVGDDGKMAYSTDGGGTGPGGGTGGGGNTRTYTLTADGKTSTGTVDSFSGNVFTLRPSASEASPFTATVSGTSITAMSGTITWDTGTSENAPSTFTPPATNPGGASLSFSNEQVYKYGLDLDEMMGGGNYNPNDMFTYRNYTGTDTLTSNAGGSGKITNGKMSFSIGTPSADVLEKSDQDNILALKEYYTTVKISDTNARGVTLMIKTADGKLLQRQNQQGMEAIMGGSGTMVTESVYYFYSDRAYTMQLSGGKNLSEDPKYTFVMPNMNLTCKAGWNTMYTKMSMTLVNEDITKISMDIKMGDLQSCKWVLTTDYSGGVPGTPGGGDSGTTWPNNTLLTEFGLSGLTAPAGAQNIFYMSQTVAQLEVKSLVLTWENGTAAHDTYVDSRFTSNSWTLYYTPQTDGGYSAMYQKEGFQAAIYIRDSDGDCTITINKYLSGTGGDPGTDPGGGDPGTNPGGGDPNMTPGFPPDSVLSRYSLSGLQIQGSDFSYQNIELFPEYGIYSLKIKFIPTSGTLANLHSWLMSRGWDGELWHDVQGDWVLPGGNPERGHSVAAGYLPDNDSNYATFAAIFYNGY